MTFQLRNIRDIPNIVDAKLLYYHSYYQNLSNKYNLNLFRMRIKSIFAVLLAIATMASCSDNVEGEGPDPGTDPSGTAYMSLSVTYPDLRSRAAAGTSDEDDGDPKESVIDEFYVLTFNSGKALIKHSTADKFFVKITGSTSGGALKVNPATTYLLVVANPGAKFEDRLVNGLSDGMTYDAFNAVIDVPFDADTQTPDILVKEIMGDVDAGGIGTSFTMINVGTYDETQVDSEWPADGLLDVSAKLKKVVTTVSDPDKEFTSDDAAKQAASKDKAVLKIERLAAKMVVKSTNPTVEPVDKGAPFSFGGWLLDYRNSKYFPYAVKSHITAVHTDDFYANNFYTEDPNYSSPDHTTGIILNKADDTKSVPVDGLWKGNSGIDYCIENTMAAEMQKFGAATRVVIKGTYTPTNTFTAGEHWFYFDGVNYNLTSLKQAYAAAVLKADAATPSEKLFIAASDKFLEIVKAKNNEITTIADLEASHLNTDKIANGGELTKLKDCLWWYQNGLNYYIYEIRHDNTTDLPNMAFGKYGVVRNNWYNLNLTKVRGKGTPWYPGDGPDDPDPGEDIDQDSAYLDFEIQVGPWVFWETDFEI